MTARWMTLAALLGAGAVSDGVVVKREGARVMKAPRFFGEACPVEVAAGQQVRVVERRGGWGRLEEPGEGRCWLHETAWSDRDAGDLVGDPANASQRDMELAGRGFSESEEGRYRADHPGLEADFALVEAYLARAPEPQPGELALFLAGGKLGGAR